jgi:hypothetical protein
VEKANIPATKTRASRILLMKPPTWRKPTTDPQTIELMGRHHLAAELLQAGLEVAEPSRDRGVDLIAYTDIDKQVGRFVARPIQMKAASQRSYGIWKKYLKIHDLIFAFVWHMNRVVEPEIYALTCVEANEIGRAMGWTRSASWKKNGGYVTTKPSDKLLRLLKPHRMTTPEQWWNKVTTPSFPGRGVDTNARRETNRSPFLGGSGSKTARRPSGRPLTVHGELARDS